MPWKIASSRKAYLHGAIFLGLLQNTFVMLTVFRKTRAALSILNVSSSYRSAFAWLDGWTQRQFNKSLFWALSDKPFSPLDRHIDKCDTPRRALNYLAIDTSKQAMSATSHLKVEHNNVNYILGRIPYSCTLLAPKNGLSPSFWRLNNSLIDIKIT